ncbi:hypothetical protein GCM10009839_70970 [Catenulispora yoronensis]|uniref:Integral membrane protein n=1 Tax=Catenulispora yoronensis TaxID=450799 RepID=A0ABN2V6L1_9ACTN
MSTPSTDVTTDEVDEIVPELVDEDLLLLDDDEGDAGELVGGAAEDAAPAAESGSGSVIAAGAAAVTAAGLALVSLTGSWLGNVLAQRQTLLGQIASANATADKIIKEQYANPWHRTAFVSMGFAVAAVLVAAATLVVGRFVVRSQPPVWVRALAWGALAIGIVGIGVSAAMYFDVFAGTITVPAGS